MTDTRIKTLQTLNQQYQLENIRLKNEVAQLKRMLSQRPYVEKPKLSTSLKKSSDLILPSNCG